MSRLEINRFGDQHWYNSDVELHREDGPALIYEDGYQAWYLNGHRIFSNKDFQEISGITDEDMMVIVLKYGNVK